MRPERSRLLFLLELTGILLKNFPYSLCIFNHIVDIMNYIFLLFNKDPFI